MNGHFVPKPILTFGESNLPGELSSFDVSALVFGNFLRSVVTCSSSYV